MEMKIEVYKIKNRGNKDIFQSQNTFKFYKYMKNKMKKGNHKNKEFVLPTLLIVPGVKMHFKDPRMYNSNIKYKKS